MSRNLNAVLGVLGVLILTACSSGSAQGDRLFLGTVAGGGGGSGITITVISDKPSGATSSTVKSRIVTAAQSIDLTGTADDTGAITLSGSGWSIQASLKSDQIEGQYTDDSGSTGQFSGQDATNGGVQRYCGRYSGDDSGVWNLQGGSGGVSGSFSGQLASGNLSGSESGTGISLSFQSLFVSGSASGTVSGSSVSGSWGTSDGAYKGQWSGSSSCPSQGGGGAHANDGCCKPASNGRTACCIDTCPCG